MPILGNIIKNALSITSEVDFNLRSPFEKQERTLRDLLKSAQNTSFGKYYDFQSILHQEDIIRAFKRNVPIHQYDDIHNKWWIQQQKVRDITWPDKPDFFALSSGTTGKASKRIPVTSEFIQSMRKVSFDLLKTIPDYEVKQEMFESEVLIISSSANLQSNQQGHLEGEISGINIYNMPGWSDFIYRPGKEIAQIGDWHERLNKIVEHAPEWNIGAMAGIPSWVLQVLKAIVKRHKLDSILDIWPNLSIYMSGGVAYETYRDSFNQLCGSQLNIVDTYLASEGFFAYGDRQGEMAMALALQHGYFYEFIPFDERGFDEMGNLKEEPVSFGIDEVDTETEYAMIISTCAGAWRYMIGDTIKFVDLEPHRILITGRTKFFLNVTGSQLSEEKLDKAITTLSSCCGQSINEYSVGVLTDENDEYYHQWVIVSPECVDEAEATRVIDETLMGLNKNYKVARGKALKGIRVKSITQDNYLKWIEKDKKLGGQIKTPKVMSAQRMQDFMSFINA